MSLEIDWERLPWSFERLRRSNPVLCLRGLLASRLWDDRCAGVSMQRVRDLVALWAERGTIMPPHELRRLEQVGCLPCDSLHLPCPAVPRVVGLVVDEDRQLGLVNPLHVAISNRWDVPDTLPFLFELQTALKDLLDAAVIPSPDAIPETLGLRCEDTLAEPIRGRSLTVAAVLAVIDTLNDGKPNVFDCACAVVQLDPDGHHLRPVGTIRLKLDAMVREHGGGTLLVRTSGDNIAGQYDGHFETVWKVDTYCQLADRLADGDGRDLLAPLRATRPLRTTDLQSALYRLEALIEQRHWYVGALNLAGRLQRAVDVASAGQPSRTLPARMVRRLLATSGDLHRHLGQFNRAVEHFESAIAWAASGQPETCYSDEVRLVTALAAACYDAHDFDRLEQLLRPWYERLSREPRLVDAELRIEVQNTLARGRSAAGRGGWGELLRDSRETQLRIDPLTAPRTTNYLVHALLGSGQLEEAEHELTALAEREGGVGLSGQFQSFLRADLARRRGTTWSSESLDGPAADRRFETLHPRGFYLQATARQSGRTAADTAWRFTEAARCFHEEADPCEVSVLQFLELLMELGIAVAASDAGRWRQTRERVTAWLAGCGSRPLQAWYQVTARSLGEVPSATSLDRLLERVPYF